MRETEIRSAARNSGFLRFAPLIIWVGLIFVASSATGSMSNTSIIIRPLLHWLFPNAPDDVITTYHGLIRKAAHFIEYAILAFWASRAFWGSAREFVNRYWYGIAFAVVLLTASLDEFNQSFNPARTSSPYDVALDCIGGLTMIAVLAAIRRFRSASS